MDCNDFKDDELAFEARPNIFFTLDDFFFIVEFDTNRLELKLGGASSSCLRKVNVSFFFFERGGGFV